MLGEIVVGVDAAWASNLTLDGSQRVHWTYSCARSAVWWVALLFPMSKVEIEAFAPGGVSSPDGLAPLVGSEPRYAWVRKMYPRSSKDYIGYLFGGLEAWGR